MYVRFRNAIEQGIRNVALSGSRLFRTGSIATREKWQATDIWRKHRCVLFITRYFHKSENYSYFHNFRMRDHLQRERVIKTYDARHRLMTTGVSDTKYDLLDPPGWGDAPPPAAESTAAAAVSAAAAAAGPAATEEDVDCIWDSDKEEWIKVCLSSCLCVCVLMLMCVCPHGFVCVSSRRFKPLKPHMCRRRASERPKSGLSKPLRGNRNGRTHLRGRQSQLWPPVPARNWMRPLLVPACGRTKRGKPTTGLHPRKNKLRERNDRSSSDI